MNHHQLLHAAKGSIGMGTILATEIIPDGDLVVIVKLIIQAVVAIGTLYQMYKSRTKKK